MAYIREYPPGNSFSTKYIAVIRLTYYSCNRDEKGPKHRFCEPFNSSYEYCFNSNYNRVLEIHQK